MPVESVVDPPLLGINHGATFMVTVGFLAMEPPATSYHDAIRDAAGPAKIYLRGRYPSRCTNISSHREGSYP